MPRPKKQIKHLRRARKEIQRCKSAKNPETDIPADLLARLGIPDLQEPALPTPPENTCQWPDLDETEDELEYSDGEEIDINPFLVEDSWTTGAPCNNLGTKISNNSSEAISGLGANLWERMRGASKNSEVLQKIKLPYTRGQGPSRRTRYRALANQRAIAQAAAGCIPLTNFFTPIEKCVVFLLYPYH